MKNDDSQEYVNDLKEWEDKMYQPGVYVGGKWPLHIKYGGRKIGFFLFVTGLFVSMGGVSMIFHGGEDRTTGIVMIGLSILLLLAGINKIKDKKT